MVESGPEMQENRRDQEETRSEREQRSGSRGREQTRSGRIAGVCLSRL
jgi:hypothetical protein